ncbi:hypothetical protein QM588_10700 [Rhodococcus sp. IEGM 1354]|uniref:hypothetical protein n=1 Tax=Rhodococcus sp. IEGM 1354 TaxID=3047088 RepID=UPI0024B7A35F|nr:hypothetical protein [Rhodococcus sp. IEGM 1354]MDI9930869.1 hypothetical protein [Rhodococcus sp. IEGM 1354]
MTHWPGIEKTPIMDLQPYVVHRESDVTGAGVVLIEDSGDAFLAPNTPSSNRWQVERVIPLRHREFDLAWDGVWVRVIGRTHPGGIEIRSALVPRGASTPT